MKFSFTELKNALFKSNGFSNSQHLLLEAGQDANAIGATITEVFPCIYWYFNAKQGLTINDVMPLESSQEQSSDYEADNENISNEQPTIPDGFLDDVRSNVGNPFKFKNSKINDRDAFHIYLNDTMQNLFSKGGRNALTEKLQQANAIYRKLKTWCAGKNVKGIYWTADKAGKVEELVDLHSEADICIEYVNSLGAVSYYSISIKADANAFNKSNTLKASNRSLRTWFLPIKDYPIDKLIEPIRDAVNGKLVYNGFSAVQSSGWTLRGDEGLNAIYDNYSKIKQLILNRGLGSTVSHLSTIRSELEDVFVTSFIEVMKSLSPAQFKKVIENSLGYGPGLHVWKANNNQCKDITNHVKLLASEIDNVDGFTIEGVKSQAPKTLVKNPADSIMPNVIFKWTNNGREYKLSAQIRLADSFAKARKSRDDTDASTSVLNKTLDKFIESDIGKSKRMQLAYDQGFFKSVLFAIFFKPVETWKIMTILPGSHSVVNESYDDAAFASYIKSPRSWHVQVEGIHSPNANPEPITENIRPTITFGELKRLINENLWDIVNGSTPEDDEFKFEIEDGVLKEYNGKDENVVIPDGVTAIGKDAFKKCKCVKSVTMPSSVTEISYSAFEGCGNLESVTLSDSLEKICVNAFAYCKSLASITIPESVVKIGAYAFDMCESLKSINMLGNVQFIDDWAFSRCTSLESVVIPSGIKFIGKGLFSDCHNLKTVTIPNTVTYIDDSAFSTCYNLKSITLPSSVYRVDNRAFFGCDEVEIKILNSKLYEEMIKRPSKYGLRKRQIRMP